MRPITFAALAGLCLVLSACATLPPPDPAKLAPVMRPYIENALTKPMAELDKAARGKVQGAVADTVPPPHNGAPGDRLTLGLALTAKRSNFDQVPQPWHSRLVMRDARLQVARSQYRRDHPQEAVPENGKLLAPTVEEQKAETIAKDYSDPEPWLVEAELATTSTMTSIYVPPVRVGGTGTTQLINISQPALPRGVVRIAAACVSAVYDELQNDSMMTDLINGLSAAVDADESIADKGEKADSAKILNEVHEKQANDPKHMADEAKCGGREAYAHYLGLMRPIFVPSSRVTVTTQKSDAKTQAKPNP